MLVGVPVDDFDPVETFQFGDYFVECSRDGWMGLYYSVMPHHGYLEFSGGAEGTFCFV